MRLIGEGARVVATDVVEQRLADLAAELDGRDIVTVAGDVSDVATIDAILEATEGTADGLASVAGIMDSFLPPRKWTTPPGSAYSMSTSPGPCG
ncbi:hypothetical protein [Dactylosporangium cerinum]